MTPVGLEHYLVISALLFCLGVTGVIIRRNLLVIYMSIELMLNAANLALVAFSRLGPVTRAELSRAWWGSISIAHWCRATKLSPELTIRLSQPWKIARANSPRTSTRSFSKLKMPWAPLNGL